MKKISAGNLCRTLSLWARAAAASLAVASLSMVPLAMAQAPKPPSAAPPAGAPGAEPAAAPTPDQVSYLFGLMFGTQLRNAGMSNEVMVIDAITRGLNDGLQGK
ncbi:MAG: hypothetical protein ACLPV8_04330, partial [Steroidobacteraceae bacterium]